MLHTYFSPSYVKEEVQTAIFESRIVAIDMVVSDTLKLLRPMTNHDSVYNLISRLTLLKDLPYMSKVSETRLMNGLTDFTHPGGPYFPSRPLRHLAAKVMTLIFPGRPAKRARKVVHSFFRMLHPYYWAESVSYHTLEYAREGFRWVGDKLVKGLCRRTKGILVEDEDEVDESNHSKND